MATLRTGFCKGYSPIEFQPCAFHYEIRIRTERKISFHRAHIWELASHFDPCALGECASWASIDPREEIVGHSEGTRQRNWSRSSASLLYSPQLRICPRMLSPSWRLKFSKESLSSGSQSDPLQLVEQRFAGWRLALLSTLSKPCQDLQSCYCRLCWVGC